MVTQQDFIIIGIQYIFLFSDTLLTMNVLNRYLPFFGGQIPRVRTVIECGYRKFLNNTMAKKRRGGSNLYDHTPRQPRNHRRGVKYALEMKKTRLHL